MYPALNRDAIIQWLKAKGWKDAQICSITQTEQKYVLCFTNNCESVSLTLDYFDFELIETRFS
jgi:hypothetical protein